MLQQKLILVTGAQGWLGSRLMHVLQNGLEDVLDEAQPGAGSRIRCMLLPGSKAPTAAMGTEFMHGDLRNPADCQTFCADAKGALLFHTAGIIHPRRVRDFYEINTQGTRNLLSAAEAAGVKRAVVVSSNSPCGCNPHPDHLFDESSRYKPYMHYGRSKMLMELAVREHQARGVLETVIMRPPWFYGPNQPPRQTLFFRMIRQGKAPIVGSGNDLRSMGYLDNLCQGLLLAAVRNSANGQTYWIADRAPYSMNAIINTVEALLEREFHLPCAHKRLRLPSLASTAAFYMDKCLQAAGIYHQKIHVLSEMNKTIVCSIQKAEKELGFCPRISLEEGMRRSIAWCLAAGREI